MAEGSGYSEVAQLQHSVLCHENVLGLQVAMQDALLVKVLKSEGDLNKVVSHRGL